MSKKVTENSRTTTTAYLTGFQYKNAVLQFFPHAEGYVNATQSGTSYTFNYVFNYTDHLGNIRLSYTKDPTSAALKVIEETHYYPFGLKHTNYNSDRLAYIREGATLKVMPVPPLFKTIYNYKYNGKEWQDELGLNMTAMDFRQYDNAIGRFVVIDPMAEQAHDLSPYRFGFNNPLLFSDPTGLWEETSGGWSTSDSGDIAAFMSAFSRNGKGDRKKLDIFVTGKTSKGSILEDNRNEAIKTETVLTELFGYSTLRTVDLSSKDGVSELTNSLQAFSNEGFSFNSFIISSHGDYKSPSFKIGEESINTGNYNKTKELNKYFKGSSVYVLACHAGGGADLEVSMGFVQGLSNLWGATVYANRSWGIPLQFGGAMHTNTFDAMWENKIKNDGRKFHGESLNGQFLKANPGNKTPSIINNLRIYSYTFSKGVIQPGISNTHK